MTTYIPFILFKLNRVCFEKYKSGISSVSYGPHSVPKPFNKLIHLAYKINQFSVFNKITL